MGKIFDLNTQFRNPSNRWIGFRVDDGFCLLPEVPPRKTRMVKQSYILRRLREIGSGWKIRVLLDGRFTGIELDPHVVLDYVRVLFRIENESVLDVVCVDGVRENRSSDFLLRHRYFGCMRNYFWDGRPIEPINRSDWRLATKLRNLEGDGLHLAPFVDTTLVMRPCESPLRKADKPNVTAAAVQPKPPPLPSPPTPHAPPLQIRPIGQATVHTADSSADESSTCTNNMDAFVHAILFLFALSLVRFVPMLFV